MKQLFVNSILAHEHTLKPELGTARQEPVTRINLGRSETKTPVSRRLGSGVASPAPALRLACSLGWPVGSISLLHSVIGN